MFRSSSRHKTACYVLGNVIWGTSLGGLVLFAEERRRQVLLAQRILETGIILQAFKSYHNATLIPGSEQGGSSTAEPTRDSEVAHLPSHHHLESIPSSYAWSKRKRRRKELKENISTVEAEHATRPSSTASSILSSNVDDRRATTLRPPMHPKYSRESRKPLFKRKAIFQPPNRASVGTTPVNPRYPHIRYPFSTPANYTRDSMSNTQLIHAENAKYLSHGARSHSTSLAATKVDIEYNFEAAEDFENDNGSFNNDIESSIEPEDAPHDSESLARRIRNSLEEGDLNNAFADFVRLCDNVTGPISIYVRGVVRQLVDAYKSVGMSAMVWEVQQRVLHFLQDWSMITEDFEWLMERVAPEELSKLCAKTMQPLVRLGRAEKAIEFTLVALQTSISWRRRGQISEGEPKAVSDVLVHINIDSVTRHIYRKLWDVYNQAIDTGLLDIAKSLRQWVQQQGIGSLKVKAASLRRAYETANTNEAVELYVSTLRNHSKPEKIFEASQYLNLVDRILGSGDYASCNRLVFSVKDLNLDEQLSKVLSILWAQLDLVEKLNLSESQTAAWKTFLRNMSAIAYDTEQHDAAQLIFDIMELCNERDDVLFFNVLATCSLAGEDEKAIKLAQKYSPTFAFPPICREQILQSALNIGQLKLVKPLLKTLDDYQNLPEATLRAIYNYKDEDFAPKALWRLLQLYSQRGAYEDVQALLGTTHGFNDLDVSSATLKYQAFALGGPLTETKEVLHGLAESNVDLVSDQIQDSHFALLQRIWERTRNFELTQETFNTMQRLNGSTALSIKVYSQMILASVKAGRLSIAQGVANHMTRVQKLEPNIHILGHLMLAKAKESRWAGVKRILERAVNANLIPSRDSPDITFINSTFVEFSRQHGYESTFTFAKALVKNYGICATRVMSALVVDKLVDSERLDLLEQWLAIANHQGLEIEKGTFARLRQRASRLRRQGAELPEAELQGSQVSTMKVKSFDQRQSTTTPKSINLQMLTALSKNKPAKAVQIVSSTIARGSTPTRKVLKLLLDAGMRAGFESLQQAELTLREAEAMGVNTDICRATRLVYGLRDRQITFSEASQIVVEFYKTLDQEGYPISHDVTMAAAKNLLAQNRAKQAAHIMDKARTSRWIKQHPFDMANATTWLQIVVRAGDIKGIKRVVNYVLVKQLRIDEQFIDTLKVCRQIPKRREERKWQSSDPAHSKQMLEALDTGIALCRERMKKQRAKSAEFVKEAIELVKGTGGVGRGMNESSIGTARSSIRTAHRGVVEVA